ncbi:hypothetical protein GCM10012278_30750 [Nonomuraea glycinis]|uniref:Uncharacterized protein n=1 Tax=Nonomuraea glycinis TaxID=2047744 RepID=A0A918E4E9_9ACTN|nr:hypothetical protein GCM10012278_30750 [Nonomuraea glycinis]
MALVAVIRLTANSSTTREVMLKYLRNMALPETSERTVDDAWHVRISPRQAADHALLESDRRP